MKRYGKERKMGGVEHLKKRERLDTRKANARRAIERRRREGKQHEEEPS